MNDINSIWLGKMQNELGVLSSNIMLSETKIESLNKDLLKALAEIESFKEEKILLLERIKKAEDLNEELKLIIQPERKKRNVKNAT